MVRELGTEGSQGTAQTHVPNRQGHAESQDPFLVHENIYVINEGSGDGSLELNEKKASSSLRASEKLLRPKGRLCQRKLHLRMGKSLPTQSLRSIHSMKSWHWQEGKWSTSCIANSSRRFPRWTLESNKGNQQSAVGELREAFDER